MIRAYMYTIGVGGLVGTLLLLFALRHLSPVEATVIAVPAATTLLALLPVNQGGDQKLGADFGYLSALYLLYGVELMCVIVLGWSVIDTVALVGTISVIYVPLFVQFQLAAATPVTTPTDEPCVCQSVRALYDWAKGLFQKP